MTEKLTCVRNGERRYGYRNAADEHEVEEVIFESAGVAGCLKQSESKFTHYNRHWDTLQITVPNDSYSFCCRTTDTLEQSIMAAKAMIREKKQA